MAYQRNTNYVAVPKKCQFCKNKVTEIESLQEKIQAEYDQLKAMNDATLADSQQLVKWGKLHKDSQNVEVTADLTSAETELSPAANSDCDYQKLVDECFSEELQSDQAAYELCSQQAGCTVGATRRPMYDKMSFRRKQ